jgi:hypothetical protein
MGHRIGFHRSLMYYIFGKPKLHFTPDRSTVEDAGNIIKSIAKREVFASSLVPSLAVPCSISQSSLSMGK